MRKRIGAAVIAVAAALTLSACGDKGWEFSQDAPIGQRDAEGAADLINFPDGYANAATKCNNGNRIYVTSNDSNGKAIAVVPNDPTCAGAVSK